MVGAQGKGSSALPLLASRAMAVCVDDAALLVLPAEGLALRARQAAGGEAVAGENLLRRVARIELRTLARSNGLDAERANVVVENLAVHRLNSGHFIKHSLNRDSLFVISTHRLQTPSQLALSHIATIRSNVELEPVVGIEPTTDGLQNRCSTTELNWLKTIDAIDCEGTPCPKPPRQSPSNGLS